MLVELSIIPAGSGGHISDELAEVLKIVSHSDLPYQLTPTSTCIEGDWHEVMAVVKLCHEKVREHSSHVFTMIKIEDEADETGKLVKNVASVVDKAGKPMSRP